MFPQRRFPVADHEGVTPMCLPEAELERQFIADDLSTRSDPDSRASQVQASSNASAKLAEIQSRSQYVRKIHS